VSPHYYYQTDNGWQFEGALETLMHNIDMFDRTGPTDLDGFEARGPIGWRATSLTSRTE